LMRPQWGAFGRAKEALSLSFVSQAAADADVAGRLGLESRTVPVQGTRKLAKGHMLHNDACPEVTVDPETFEVRVDGELATCEPADELPLAQRYMLR
ncbi:MAG: urease subunit alpha, partial [Rhodospirillales bacterium]|nr:urease subunit alpha [Rhodospirillales bacterium]